MRVLAGATVALRRIVDLALVMLIGVVLLAVVLDKGAPLVGRRAMVIGGGSMEPAIGLGAAIVIAPADPAALSVGDVVSLQVDPARSTYTHRIVAVVDRADGRWIRTKGDGNAEPDPTLVPATAVIGRVELVVPLAGYLLALLSLPMGVLFVVGLAVMLLAIAWLLESVEPDTRPARHGVGGATTDRPALPVEPIAAQPGGAALSSATEASWAVRTRRSRWSDRGGRRPAAD